MLRNPTYAGAYAYGKTRFIPQNGAPHKRRKKRVDASLWKVLIKEHHEGYIDWPAFEGIQTLLMDNFAAYCQKSARGTPRNGSALLQGIVFCGQCGHQMTIQYRQGAKYTCNRLHQERRLPVCQVVGAQRVDTAVIAAFWKALAPAELELLEQAQSQLALNQAYPLRLAI
jgi:hypothetical protein